MSVRMSKDGPLAKEKDVAMKRTLTAVFSLILMLASVQSQATLVRQLGLDELATQASVIVKAKVSDKQIEEDGEEGGGRVVAYYTLEVQDWIKGDATADNKLVIKQVADGEYTVPGGVTMRQKFYIPQYEVGKTYVFFLPEAHHKTGLLAPIALGQGVYDVVTVDGVDTVPQLKARAKMLGLKTKNTNPGLVRMLNAATVAGSGETTYSSFKSLIQAAGVEE